MLRCLAATATHLYVRDDREASLFMRRDARQMKLIWVKEEARYFPQEGWTGRIRLMRLEKLAFRRSKALVMVRGGRVLRGRLTATLRCSGDLSLTGIELWSLSCDNGIQG
jgi:hypothetical protein